MTSERLFNNADSFAHSFDQAWALHQRNQPQLDAEILTRLVLDHLREHPFAVNQPELARQVAAFRIRLLGL